MKRRIKSFVLIILIVGSIYQVITLWFDNVSDRNFFYTFIESATDIITEPNNGRTNEHMIRPRQLGVYLGTSDMDFTVVKSSNPYYEDFYNESIEAITIVLKEGKLADKFKIDDSLWQDRGIVFMLSFPLSRTDLAIDLGVSPSVFGQLSSVKSLGVIPANNQNNLVQVFFINEGNNEVYLYTLSENELQEVNDHLNGYIAQMEDVGMPAYMSTYDIWYIKSNILLPLTTEDVFYSDEIDYTIPFVIDDVIDKDTLKSYINNYFANPNIVWIWENAEGIIYSDDSAVVKYDNKGVLEYTNISNRKDAKLTIPQALNVAQEFIVKDTLLTKDDYYLVRYIKKDNTITFYYDYKYNDIPIQQEDTWTEDDLSHYPMEITIENGIAKRYKRALMIWDDSNGLKEIKEISPVAALNEFLNTNDVSNDFIEDMYLSYVKVENTTRLMWIMKYKGEYFTVVR